MVHEEPKPPANLALLPPGALPAAAVRRGVARGDRLRGIVAARRRGPVALVVGIRGDDDDAVVARRVRPVPGDRVHSLVLRIREAFRDTARAFVAALSAGRVRPPREGREGFAEVLLVEPRVLVKDHREGAHEAYHVFLRVVHVSFQRLGVIVRGGVGGEGAGGELQGDELGEFRRRP